MDNRAGTRSHKTLTELPTLFIGSMLPPIFVVLVASIIDDASLKAFPNLIAVTITGAMGSIGLFAINPLRKIERWWRAALWAIGIIKYALLVLTALAISWLGPYPQKPRLKIMFLEGGRLFK